MKNFCRKRKQKVRIGMVLSMVVLLILVMQGTAYAENEGSGIGTFFSRVLSGGLFSDASIDTERCPGVVLENKENGGIVKVEIREGGASGSVLTTLTDTSPSALLLKRGGEYTLTVSVHKTNETNTEGYVRLRFGSEGADGAVSYNGLIFKNPPGARYTVGAIEGHSYLDAVSVRVDAENPTYGLKSSTYSMQDGVFIYHEKNELAGDHEVQFAMQFTVDDVGYDGSGWLDAGLQLQTGTMTDGKFTADATLTASLPVESKTPVKGAFNGTSKSAALGGDGQILTYYTQESETNRTPLGLIYQKNEFDILYPEGAEIGDFGFSTSYGKEDNTRGAVEKVGVPTSNGDGTMTQHFCTSCGYMPATANPYYYYYLTFPEKAFQDGQKVTTTLTNMTFTYLTVSGEKRIMEVEAPATPVTYTIVDPTKDSTAMTVINRSTGDGVFNITGTADVAEKLVTSFGGCRIQNTPTEKTPFDKTYEAQFNTTNTAAAVTYVTVPLGDAQNPSVKLTGKQVDGTTKTVMVENPLEKKLSGSSCMLFCAKDYGFTTFTAVNAEIGKLVGNFDSSTWTYNFDLSANLSGAYGYFTTDEPGIVVKNTYRIHNTEPAYQQYTNGDLSVTSQVVSAAEARLGYSGSNSKITDGEKGTTTVTAVPAGDAVMVDGTVWPYQVPYAEGYRTSYGASENLYGNTSFLADPVFFVTLPAGMTLDTESLYFRTDDYNYFTAKTTSEDLAAEDYVLENISYMNQSEEDMNLYRVTFPDLTLGYFTEETDNGSPVMLRRKLYFKVRLKTSKSLKTQTYYTKDLFGISSEHPVTALPYSSNTTSLCSVIEDRYGINGGRDYAAVLNGIYAQAGAGFGVQQQAEVNVNNAIVVENIEGSDTTSDWLTYDPSDPNSILMMGRKTSGQYRLRVNNTGSQKSTDVSILVPLPKKGTSLGTAFMYEDDSDSARQGSAFSFSMDVSWKEENLSGFTANYVKLNGQIDLWNQTIIPDYEVCDKEEAEAIVLTKGEIEAGASCDITLDYQVDDQEELPNKRNVFRNIFRYTTGTETYSGLGSYVACEIAEGKLSGQAFADSNRNGLQDEGEPALPGISVVTKDGQGKILSTITDENGEYRFSAIREEEITVTYGLGTNSEYRFNVPVDDLKPASDKKTATAYYETLGENEVMNLPLSTCWTLTYDGNGATSGLVPAAQEYDPDNARATVRVKPDNLYRKYYAFDSWNTAADGSGTKYLPNAQFTMTGDLTLYAQWVTGTYTATIDYQGGSSTSGITGFTVTYGEKFFSKLPEKETVVREGYTFSGWASSLTTTGRYNVNTTWSREDGIVYARYTELNDFDVTYNTDGGTEIPQKTNLKWTESVIPDAVPAKNGYDFAGWTFDGKTVASDTAYGTLAKDDEIKTITLTAAWTAKTGYTVTYDLADETLTAPDPITVTWTQTGLLPATAPVRGGYAFAGWYYGSGDGATAVTAADAYSSLAALDTVTGITLQARWTEINQQKLVHYNTNGGTAVNDKLVENAESAGLIPTEAAASVKPGYTLQGWTYIKDKGTDAEEIVPVDATTVYGTLSAGDSITLNAVWTPKKYRVQYGETTLQPLIEKYWTDSDLLSNEAKNLSRVGYVFDGWFYGTVPVTDITTIAGLIPEDDAPDDTIILTAGWTERTYSIVYDTNGSTSVVPTQTGIGYTTSSLIPSATPEKTGYCFDHWEYGTGAAAHSIDSSTTVADLIGDLEDADDVTSLTLQAVYRAKSGYSVKYDTAGGTEIEDKTEVAWTDGGLLPENTPTRTGYTFSGWSGGRVSKVTESTTYGDIAENNDTGSYITLVARWIIDSYVIQYRDTNQTPEGAVFTGSYEKGTVVPTKHTYGTATTLPTPTRDGYDFAGWYTDCRCTGDSVTALEADKVYSSPITLYAKWTQRVDVKGKVKIIYNPPGSEPQAEDQKTKQIHVTLQRRLAGSSADFTDVAGITPCEVEFTDTNGQNEAIAGFTFQGLPGTDEDGRTYEYQVTSITANYGVTGRGEKFGEETEYAYNLELTYNPDTFQVKLVMSAEDGITPEYLPTAVNAKIVFRNTKPAETFSSNTPYLSSGNPWVSEDAWICITEHADASMRIPLTGATRQQEYSVNKYWNTDGGVNRPGHYQFVIESYVMNDGTVMKQDSDENPFILTYQEACAEFTQEQGSEPYELHLTLGRTYQVSFDLQGKGTAAGQQAVIAPLHVQHGKTVPEPAASAISQTGYTLTGWYTDPECTEENRWVFAPSESPDPEEPTTPEATKVTGDQKLYARWEANSYTITLVSGTGTTAETKTLTATYDAALPEISEFSPSAPENMTFGGYYTGENGQGECYYDASGKAVGGKTYQRTENLTLYAFWTQKLTVSGTATIHYRYQNGTATSEVPSGERPTGVTIQLERRRKDSEEGYEAVKGQTLTQPFGETDDTTGRAAASYSFTGLSPIDETGTAYEYRVNAELHNFETKITISVVNQTCDLDFTFKPNNFDLPVMVDTRAITVSADRPAAVYVQVTYRANPSDTPPAGEYHGISEDWRVIGQLNGGTIRLAVDTETGIASGICSVWKETQDSQNQVYTSWYQLYVAGYEYQVNGQTVQVTAEEEPFFVTGYGAYGTYDKKTEKPTGVSAAVDRTYRVSFYNNGKGDAVPISQNVRRGAYAAEPDSQNIQEEGYHITGWYQDKNCTQPWNFAQNKVTGDVTLYAKWEADRYQIRFYDGTELLDTREVTYQGALPEINVPTKAGADFNGYYGTVDEEEVCYYDASGLQKIETYQHPESISLYARWIEKSDISGKVKVNYTYMAGNGETVTMPLAQRLDAVKVRLERRTDGTESYKSVKESWVSFEHSQSLSVTADVGTFVFSSQPETTADGSRYEYRVVVEQADYSVRYGVTIDGDTNPYNMELVYATNTFNLSMTVDARRIPWGMPESVDVKAAFIWYQPEAGAAFDGVVDGNVGFNGNAEPQTHKWRYLTEFFMNGGSVLNIPLTDGTGSKVYPVTSQGLRSDDNTVVPFYYQFVITAYHMADGTTIQTGAKNNPFSETWVQSYADADPETTAGQNLTITLDRSYTVTFDLQGKGSTAGKPAAVSPVSARNGALITSPDTAAILQTGYELEGWYRETSCKTRWDFARDPVTADTILYAHWTANTYYLRLYEDDQAENPANTVPVIYDGPLPLLVSPSTSVSYLPVRTGYDFCGYYTEKEGERISYYDETGAAQLSTYTTAEDTALYAAWSRRQYPVTKTLTNLITTDTTSQVAHGDPVSMKLEPKDQTWKLPEQVTVTMGGYPAQPGTDYSYNRETGSLTVSSVTGELVITAAGMEKARYTVEFDLKAHGTSEKPLTQVLLEGEKATKPVDPTGAAGYGFDGWYVTGGAADSEWNFDTVVTGSMTLYAKWKEETYPIIWQDKGGTVFTGTYDPGVTVPTTHTYGSDTALPTPKKTGYEFAGWYTDENCQKGKVTELKATDYVAAITLYANWIRLSDIKGKVQIDYTYPVAGDQRAEMEVAQKLGSMEVILERQGRDGQYTQVGKTVVTIPEADRSAGKTFAVEPFTFTGMPETDETGTHYEYRVTAAVSNYEVSTNVEIEGITSNYHMLLTYNPNTFDMEIRVDGSSMIEENRPAAARVKIVFCASKPTKPYEGQVDGGQTNPAMEPTKWRYITEHENGVLTVPLEEATGKGSISYPVLIHQNNDESLVFYYQFVITSYQMKDGTEQTAENLSKPFVVEYGDKDGHSAYYDNDVTAAQSVTATLNRDYTVSFYLMGKGENTDGTPAAIADRTVRNGAAVGALDTTGISQPGYELEGWYQDSQFSTKWDLTSGQVTDDMTLYAKWVARTYPITWRNKGGDEFDGTYDSGVTPPETHTYGINTALPTPKKTGYEFAGWYTDKNCQASQVTELKATEYTAAITLYANWIELSDIRGKVQIDYTYLDDGTKKVMEYDQKIPSVEVILERKDADGQFAQIDKVTVEIPEETRRSGAEYAIEAFTFSGMPETDEAGGLYEYRVTAAVSNYIVSTDVKIGTETSKYNMLLTYNPDTFDMEIKVDSSSLKAANRPVAANVKIVFCAEKPTQRYEGQVDGTSTDLNTAPGKLRYISEHEDGVLTVLMDEATGTGSISYPVLIHQNDRENMAFYYQFVITSYQMKDGSVQAAEQSGKPFIVSYNSSNLSAYYTKGASATQKVSAALDRDYTVAFDLSEKGMTADGNPASIGTQTIRNGSYVSKPDTTGITQPGYNLEGWYSDREFRTAWNFASDKVEDDMTLRARWTAIEYKLSFHDGSSLLGELAVTYDGSVPELNTSLIPTKEGHVFGGYYTEAGGTGTMYYNANGTLSRTEAYKTPGNTTLYAKWTPERYQVKKQLTNLTADGTLEDTVLYGMPLTVTLKPMENYTLPNAIAVSVKGEACRNYTYTISEDGSQGTITIPVNTITGDVKILATGIRIPEATNPEGGAYLAGQEPNPLAVTVTDSDQEIVPPGEGMVATMRLEYQWYELASEEDETGTPINGATNSSYQPSARSAGCYRFYCLITKTVTYQSSSSTQEVISTQVIQIRSETATVLIQAVEAQVPVLKPLVSAEYLIDTSEDKVAALDIGAEVGDGGTLSYQWYVKWEGDVPSSQRTTRTLFDFSALWDMLIPDEDEEVEEAEDEESSEEDDAVATASNMTKAGAGKTRVSTATSSDAATADKATSSNASADTATASDAAELEDEAVLASASNMTASMLLIADGYQEVEGGTESTLKPDVSQRGIFKYYCVVTNTLTDAYGNSSTAVASCEDHPATIVVVEARPGVAAQPPQITDPEGAVYQLGENIRELTVDAVSVDGGTLTYQWYQSSDGRNGGGTKLQGATSSTYTPILKSPGTYWFYCEVTNQIPRQNGEGIFSVTVSSNAAKIVVEGKAGSPSGTDSGDNSSGGSDPLDIGSSTVLSTPVSADTQTQPDPLETQQTPVSPDAQAEPGTEEQLSGIPSKKEEEEELSELPKTGDKTGSAGLLRCLMLIFAAVLAFMTKKKQK